MIAEVFLEILPGVPKVGPCLLEERVRVVARRKAEDFLDLGRSQHVSPIGVDDKGLEGVAGRVLPVGVEPLAQLVEHLD